MTLAQIRGEVTARDLPAEFVHPLCTLLKLDEVLDFILEPPEAVTANADEKGRNWRIKLVFGLRQRMPYMTEADKKRIRSRIKAEVKPANDTVDNYVPSPRRSTSPPLSACTRSSLPSSKPGPMTPSRTSGPITTAAPKT